MGERRMFGSCIFTLPRREMCICLTSRSNAVSLWDLGMFRYRILLCPFVSIRYDCCKHLQVFERVSLLAYSRLHAVVVCTLMADVAIEVGSGVGSSLFCRGEHKAEWLIQGCLTKEMPVGFQLSLETAITCPWRGLKTNIPGTGI